VLAGHADVHHFDLDARVLFCLGYCLADGLHGLFDVDHHPAVHAVGVGFAQAQDVDLAVLVALAYDGANLGSPNIQPDDDLLGIRGLF